MAEEVDSEVVDVAVALEEGGVAVLEVGVAVLVGVVEGADVVDMEEVVALGEVEEEDLIDSGEEREKIKERDCICCFSFHAGKTVPEDVIDLTESLCSRLWKFGRSPMHLFN